MKKLLYILPLLLSGCYLANGSPSSYIFWQAPEGIDEVQEKKIWNDCGKKAYNILNEEQRKLFDKGNTSWEEVYENKIEYQKYKEIIQLNQKYFFQCLYDSGLRFRPSLKWCLAQDGNNTRTCIENMKYRN